MASTSKSRSTEAGISDRGGYCGAIQRAPPAMPAVLARRLANKENPGLGKVSFSFWYKNIVERMNEKN